MNFRYAYLVIIFSSLLLSGCATNRSITDIKMPQSKEIAQNTGKEVFIKLPVDKRVYKKNPIADNEPSLNPRRTQTGSVKERAYGRKTNGYNQRIGDVLLPRKKSVSLLMQKTLQQAFLEKGFKIIEDERDINENTYIVNTDILTFWTWHDSKDWEAPLHAQISTQLSITIGSSDVPKFQLVSVKVVHAHPTIFERKWSKAMRNAISVYIDSLKKQL